MIASAPGKVVLSGAYAVLEGAPAIVSAVDRYVHADATRPSELVTPEVRAAIGDARAPWFDASALRENNQKLGVGSSAAILVASLAALELERAQRGRLSDEELCAAVLERALVAHAQAQGGGSGIDVATSARGGTLILQRSGGQLQSRRAALPASLHVELWATHEPASTPALLGKVRALAERDPSLHRELLNAQRAASEAAAHALEAGDARELVEQLARQCGTLARLGEAAGAGIVTSSVQELAGLARAGEGPAAVLPSGAGGGDIVLYVALQAPSAELAARAAQLGYRTLPVELGARGVHARD